MKTSLNYWSGLLLLISNYIFGQNTVYMDAREKGTGILKSRTGECFVTTPAHVVKNENRPFFVRGARNVQSKGEFLQDYQPDLAIVRIVEGGDQDCEDWNTVPDYEKILAKSTEGVLETAQTNGGIKFTKVFITEKDNTYITVRTHFPNDQIMKGMSGSSLFTTANGNKVYLGMLLEIKGANEGVVLQANIMEKILSGFFEKEIVNTADKEKGASPTVSQSNRYKSMIAIINELLPNSTKAYEVTTNIIRTHEDCNTVEQAININKVVGSSLKSLVKNIYEDAVLVNESNFNVRPIKDLILEIDQWQEEYNQIADKRKSPCKLPMFPPMQYLMLRSDLINLKGELNQRLGNK